jgi:predicted TIM-barrel fold metal-dependent hydrolase
MTTVGQDRVMWGTDFPLQDWAVSIAQVKDVIKDEKVHKKILRDNAIKCFKL